jgi:hypothetical protein
MFIGHYGPAVYDVLRSGKVKLWHAFLAVQAMDIVFCLFALVGMEGAASVVDGDLVFNIPWSHSFVSAIIIAFIVASIYRLTHRGDRGNMRGYWTMWLLAFSHWPLDWLVHRPDLPFYPGGELMMGLSLWDFAWPTYGLEVLLLGGAIAFWLVKTTGPRWTAIGAWLLVALLCTVQFFSITKTTLDQQAGTIDLAALPSGVPFAVSGLIFYFFVASVIGWLESKRTYI